MSIPAQATYNPNLFKIILIKCLQEGTIRGHFQQVNEFALGLVTQFGLMGSMTKFMHTRVRVSDLDKTINWYCDNLGFVCTRRTDKSPAGNQLAFLELEGN